MRLDEIIKTIYCSIPVCQEEGVATISTADSRTRVLIDLSTFVVLSHYGSSRTGSGNYTRNI